MQFRWKLFQLIVAGAVACANVYWEWGLQGGAVGILGAIVAYWATLAILSPKSLLWGDRPKHWVVRAREEERQQGITSRTGRARR